jgi:hypothetical protein
VSGSLRFISLFTGVSLKQAYVVPTDFTGGIVIDRAYFNS